MSDRSDTTHATHSGTAASGIEPVGLAHPLPNLRSVPLLTSRNADPQMKTALPGKAEDSSSRSPSQETEIVVPPVSLPARVSSVVLQKWEGVVLEIGEDTFTARLALLAGEGGDQIAEIYCDEIDADDRMLLEPGAVFYWSIGYLDKPSGRERFSQIRLRRLPVWSASELRIAKNKVDELGELLDGAMVQ